MKLQPIETKKAYKEIIDQLKDLIDKEVLQPGDKLPSERELVKQLNVSRPTVREALSALEIVGLVESRPGEGRFVKDSSRLKLNDETLKKFLDDSEPFELLEARITIETGTATIAAEKADDVELKSLKGILQKMEELTRAGEMALDADSDFHFMIAKIARNKFLIKTMEQIAGSMSNDLWKSVKRSAMKEESVRYKYLDDHRKIYEAIAAGEPEKAGLFMRAHLLRVWSDLLNR